MTPELILWPVVLLALVTLSMYIPLRRARVASVKSGEVEAGVYRLNEGEPSASKQINNAIANQYETPILFYAACLTAYVSDNVSMGMVVLAWLFMVFKSIHAYVAALDNKLRRRQPTFFLAFGMLILMWLLLAAHLAGIV